MLMFDVFITAGDVLINGVGGKLYRTPTFLFNRGIIWHYIYWGLHWRDMVLPKILLK